MDFAFSFSFVEKPILEGRILESDSKFEFWDDFVARSSVLVRFFGDRDRDLTIVTDWLFDSCVDPVSIGIAYSCSVSIL